MGFFKKIWKIHDQVFHPIETQLKKKGGSNTLGGMFKGAGILPKDTPETVPGSSFQDKPGFNSDTGMYDTPSTGMTLPGMAGAPSPNRQYTPNPFAGQQNLANAVRNPMPPAQSMPQPQVPTPQQPPQQQGQGMPSGMMNPQALNMMMPQGRAGMF